MIDDPPHFKVARLEKIAHINVFNMHGYEAAWILPDGVTPPDMEIHRQADHRYAAVHIETPFQNPFVTIPNSYKTLMEYMRVNALEHTEKDVIPCFETDGDGMDIYIACKQRICREKDRTQGKV